MGGGRLGGYFVEQGLPVGIQVCLEGFYQGCVDYPAVKGTRWNRIGLRLQFLYNNSLTKKYIMDQSGN